jgi:hypothetical protein
VAVDPNALPFVQCKVKLGGKDVAGAIVTLQPKDGAAQDAKGPRVMSHFDSENDCYRFTTKEGGQEKSGVPEGSYVVAVTAGRGSKTVIPAKYAKAATSGLTLDVKKGDGQFPTLELTP